MGTVPRARRSRNRPGRQEPSPGIRAGGAYYASLIAGDGKIFAASMQGVVTVFEAGDKLKVLARNDLGERIMATPAIVEGRIYVRTDKNLYAFGLK